MNLYEIQFEHFSQKDSQRGILVYLAAKSDEHVYEWLKSNPDLGNNNYIFTTYQDNERDGEIFDIYADDWSIIGTESFKERIIRLSGEINDDEVELTDLYYGKTLYGWKLVKEDVKPDVFAIVEECGINLINGLDIEIKNP